jgi:hypothetical protein
VFLSYDQLGHSVSSRSPLRTSLCSTMDEGSNERLFRALKLFESLEGITTPSYPGYMFLPKMRTHE